MYFYPDISFLVGVNILFSKIYLANLLIKIDQTVNWCLFYKDSNKNRFSIPGNSLVVQCLGCHAFTTEGLLTADCCELYLGLFPGLHKYFPAWEDLQLHQQRWLDYVPHMILESLSCSSCYMRTEDLDLWYL